MSEYYRLNVKLGEYNKGDIVVKYKIIKEEYPNEPNKNFAKHHYLPVDENGCGVSNIKSELILHSKDILNGYLTPMKYIVEKRYEEID